MDNSLIIKYLLKHPSLLIVLGVLALLTLSVVVLAEGFGLGLVSTSFVKTLGKTLCLCIIAIAMDLVWGFCGILSLPASCKVPCETVSGKNKPQG